jgi:ribosomal protein S18 acetylase RimI-like enzyme
MTDSIRIRAATHDDAATLALFNTSMALETEDMTLDPPTVRAGVDTMLAQPGLGFYLVAVENGATVGSLMITSEWSDWRNGLFWWIQSVYVVPSSRRKGVFSRLFDEVRRMATEQNTVCGLRLYVERDNKPAQQTYRGQGMEETAYRLYQTNL